MLCEEPEFKDVDVFSVPTNDNDTEKEDKINFDEEEDNIEIEEGDEEMDEEKLENELDKEFTEFLKISQKNNKNSNSINNFEISSNSEEQRNSPEVFLSKEELFPFKNDLDYLENQFQLIEYKIKLSKVDENSNEISLGLQQRRPESIKREYSAKIRSIEAKINYRMNLTKRNSNWLPRYFFDFYLFIYLFYFY